MTLARMRTGKQLHEMLREIDPQTAITPHCIYQKTRSGEWPSVQVGRKRLLNADYILSMLANPQQSMQEPLQRGTIRRIDA